MKVRETVWKGDRGEGSIFFRLDAEGRRLSSNLYISYRAERREHVVSARTDDLPDAKRELRRLTRNRANAAEGKEPLATPKAERVTIEEIVKAYLHDREHEKKCISIAAMRNHARPMIAALGGVKALELTPEHVRRYKAARRAKKTRTGKALSEAKVSRELEILKAAYGFAAEEGRIRVVPIIKLPTVKNARKVFFPLDRVPELLTATERLCVHVRDFLAWLSLSGMRPKAIRLLRWSYLDTKDWVLVLPSEEDKNEEGREIALAGEGREIIEWRSRDFSEFIFGHAQLGCTFGRGGRRLKGLTERHIIEVWNKALAEMGLPSGEKGFRPYDLKKTALRAIRRSGVPEERAMHFSGHKTASTFRRYDIVAREDNREDAQRVSDYRRTRFADSGGSDADKSAKLLRIPR